MVQHGLHHASLETYRRAPGNVSRDRRTARVRAEGDAGETGWRGVAFAGVEA